MGLHTHGTTQCGVNTIAIKCNTHFVRQAVPTKTLSTSRERADLRATDFPRTRLALLDENVEASIRCKQHSNAVGALKLQAQLIRKPRDTAVTTTSHHPACPAGVGSAALVRHGVELATTRLDVHNSVHALGMSTDMSTDP